MAYWLVKTEPSVWSWDDQVRDGTTHWHGIRNYQAANNLKAMRLGDLAFFYHTEKERRIVGVVEVAKLYYPDPSDAKGIFGMVDVKAVRPMPQPVTLEAVKAEPKLAELTLVRNSRLSVQPVDEASWKLICKMGGLG
jgi:predicted RNA-binding protein with PUA-like domain